MGKPYSIDLRERAVAAVLAGRTFAAQGGGAVRRWGEHGRQLGPAVSGDGQRGAGPDGRSQAEGDPRRA